MNVVNTYPPNIKLIRKAFNLGNKRIVFTYGDTIYNPDHVDIDPALRVHEETHAKQQGDNPAGWWKRYLKDKNFRMQQEVQAYRNQFKVFSKGKDRNRAFMFLHKIASDLSGEMYGNSIDLQGAIKLIRN